MKLNIMERIILAQLLPVEGNIAQVRILADMKRELGFTEDEVARYRITTAHEQVTWDNSADDNKDVPMGAVAIELVRERLKDMDKKKTLTGQHITLWDKFIEQGA